MIRDKRAQFYTVEKIGPNQELTPEGFLLCKNVPIARTGSQKYHPTEIGAAAGPDGWVWVTREEDEVFRPETIASFYGKPVTDDHPEDGVTSLTWRHHAVGTVMNLRREGELLVADLLIYDHDVIQLVREGKVEVSCGYEADYMIDMPGKGRQVNIVGNHVAIVGTGRCGERCSIKDSAYSRKESKMKFSDKVNGFLAKHGISTRLSDAAAADLEQELAAPASGDVHIHVPNVRDSEGEQPDAWKKKIEDGIDELLKDKKTRDEAEDKQIKAEKSAEDQVNDEAAEEVDEDEKDKAKETKDSAFLDAAFQNVVSRTEILAPGTTLPTFDGRAQKRSTLDAMHALRRKAVGKLIADADGAATVAALRGGRVLTADGLKKLDNSAVRSIFDGAAVVIERSNSHAATTGTGNRSVVQDAAPEQATVASVAQRQKDFWAKQGR